MPGTSYDDKPGTGGIATRGEEACGDYRGSDLQVPEHAILHICFALKQEAYPSGAMAFGLFVARKPEFGEH
jgi:hypothetical protein